MKQIFFSISLLFLIFACTDKPKDQNGNGATSSQSIDNNNDTIANVKKHTKNTQTQNELSDSINLQEAEAQFISGGFDDKVYYDLLIETHLCNPNYSDTTSDDSTPCSSRFFSFYPYNHKREIEDAFLLQVRAGVNNYPYRRLLIFVREEGKLVLMNGIVGYLVKRISKPNEIDDLIVAIFDDLGNDKFDRYDVLLRYKNGKYHFIEAIGDLKGSFDTPELKERATKAIRKRINDKELIF